MATRTHRSYRFAPETLAGLDERARQAGVTQTALVERYVREGLRQDAHRGIVFVDGPAGRRAAVAGGLDVWEIVETVVDNHGSVRDAAEYLDFPEVIVERAVAYYANFPDEIDAIIAENDWLVEQHERTLRKVADEFA